jgi:hypothetical protein
MMFRKLHLLPFSGVEGKRSSKHVARRGPKRNAYPVTRVSLKKIHTYEDLDAGGREMGWDGFIWVRIRTVGGVLL